MKHIELIILDLDGTLVDFPFDFFWAETHRILAEMRHAPVSQSDLEEHFSEFDYFRFLGVEGEDRTALMEQFWGLFRWNDYPTAIPFHDTVKALQKLQSKRLVMSLATARAVSTEELGSEIVELGLMPFFDCIATRASHRLDYRDKSPQISTILSHANVPPERALLIGDIPADIVAAREARLAGCIALLSGRIKETVLARENPLWISPTISHAVDEFLRRRE